MKKGFIYRFSEPNGRHPFVFIENKDAELFIGCMITSAKSNRYPNNIAMIESHFKTCSSDGVNKDYSVKFKKSNLVRLYLIKRANEVEFEPCGELTKEGIKFLEDAIKDKTPTYW